MMTLKKLRNERGSSELFAFMLTLPVILGIIIVLWMSMTWREAIRLPTNQIVNSYTQQFSAYGTDSPPEYAAFATSGQADTVTGRMREALEAAPYVKEVVSITCGALEPDGGIDPVSVIYANTAVGCEADVLLIAWPYATAIPVTDVLFGGEYRVYATGYTDRGENVNLR